MSDDDVDSEFIGFHEMGLDDRLLKAISKLGWRKPTPIQEKAIPLALEGKDVLARARTGSGKTAAFCLPVIQKILAAKQLATEQCVRAVVLTPSKELCNQAFRNIKDLTSSCSREVRCVDISEPSPLTSQRPMLMEKPDIVVGTPSRVLAHIDAGNLCLRDSLEMVIIDEADLVFSFGYELDIKRLLEHLPKIYQAFLMSATLTEDVKALKKMVLHNAVILKLEESRLPDTWQLAQYHIKCEDEDKFTLMCALFKLGLIRGKSILFVNSVDRCYKLKLFLEQFGVNACVLNSELPVNSRCHIVTQFNEDVYSYIIASDETLLADPKQKPQEKKKHKKKIHEYGVSRGIDFQNVSNVINFDFPRNVESYIHRVGRTARGSNHGTALSFVNIKEMSMLQEVEDELADHAPEGENLFKPYNFKMEEIEGFRYRARDAMRAVTRLAIRDARMKEIRQELLTTEKLKSHFEDNPQDLRVLRHDKALHTVKKQVVLKHVPDYLVPKTLKNLQQEEKTDKNRKSGKHGPSKGQLKFKKRQADPLKSFEFTGLSTKKKKKKAK
ncbi:probable ATP-dependent RNA helicase DDX56 [Haliotis asinina]|uniref:probable ATP-dependent RNA helicase DDX56 n=1 Tax=Haliotis asinina TaxID=109174 RepID=UPI0035325626